MHRNKLSTACSYSQRNWASDRSRAVYSRALSSEMYVWRERYRYELMRGMAELRRLHLVLAIRFAERGWIERPPDYFLLKLDEVSAGIADANRASAFRNIVAERKAELDTFRYIEMPLLMHEAELGLAMRRAAAALPEVEVSEWHGLCVSAGYIEGEVRVVREPTDFARMRRGAILVAPATDPSWTPLFTLASGVIVEVGGLLSHASIIAREYGLPALANVKNATRLLKDGDRVRLDATHGVVQRVRSSPHPPPARMGAG